MLVEAIAPDLASGRVLAGAQFIDAYRVTIANVRLDARQAAESILGHSPWWISMLMAMRDRLVSPFGLKTAASASQMRRIGIFPVLSESPARVVAGFDDSHLDFRILIDVTRVGERLTVTATTVVLTHNHLGRVYLAAILPFHKLIVRSMLRQVCG